MYNARIEAFRAGETLAGAQAMAPASTDLKRFCRKQVAEIIQRASVEFGIDGAPIAIDETRLPIGGYPNIWEAIRASVVPDLDRFWDLLRETYEADGPAKAERQTAATLVRAFGRAPLHCLRSPQARCGIGDGQRCLAALAPTAFRLVGACYAGFRRAGSLCASQWPRRPGELPRAVPSRRGV